MIDLTIHEEQLKRTIERAREKNICAYIKISSCYVCKYWN